MEPSREIQVDPKVQALTMLGTVLGNKPVSTEGEKFLRWEKAREAAISVAEFSRASGFEIREVILKHMNPEERARHLGELRSFKREDLSDEELSKLEELFTPMAPDS